MIAYACEVIKQYPDLTAHIVYYGDEFQDTDLLHES
jgi:hypothetical protein